MIRISGILVLCTMLLACSGEPEQQVQAPSGNGTAGSSAQDDGQDYQLVETVTASGEEILIPYRRFVYPNGLTVLLHEDKSDPLIHVNVTYHVGSAREQPQRSGFAHFFEHMMFQGSAHVGDDEHFRIVTESGGTLNGTTNADRTNYFQTVPSNQLETILWLEADRMGFLLEAVNQEKFEIQRATVKNERGQNYDNRPYGLVYEKIISALFPAGHPYSWPVIGYPEDLDAATLDDLKHFFLRWYGPNNATLVVAGNIDEEQTLRLIDKYFGGIPAGPAVERAEPLQFSLPEDRYVSYVDRNIRFPLLVMAFPSVPYNHPDRTALGALADIIGGGKKSLFYQRFVLTNRAIDASASNSAQELGGMFILEVQPFPGADLAEFETEVREMLASFNADSISDEDMETFKGRNEASLINSLESVQGKASRLAMYDYLTGEPNYMPEELEAIRSLSREDVLRVFNQYIAGQSAVVLSVLTEEEPDGQARPDNFAPEQVMAVSDNTLLDELEPRPVVDDFDRAVQPPSGQTPLVEVPPFWRQQLDNGAEIIGTVSDEVPSVTLRLEFDGGHMLTNPENYGLARLTAAMMNEGTEQLSAEQFEVELEKLGSRISVIAGTESMIVTVSALSRNLYPTLDLLEQRLFQTDFNEENLERLRKQQIEALQAAREQPSSIASDVYAKLLYGEDHNLAVPVAGEIETVSELTLDQVRQFGRDAFASEALEIVVVGDVEQQEILPALSFLDGLPRDALPEREQPPLPETSNTLYLVDKPGAAQSEIRIGYVTDMPFDATGRYFRTSLMNYVLGGAFSSRINLNLREDKGYTYGARSNFSSTERPGPFTASASVRTDTTADSVRQFVNEITAFRDSGITGQELAFMRSAVGQRDALRYETPGQKAGFLGDIIEYELPPDFVSQQVQIINSIAQDEINALAQENLPVDNMLILVVGDKAVIGESLAELGYPIVELDVEGKPVN